MLHQVCEWRQGLGVTDGIKVVVLPVAETLTRFKTFGQFHCHLSDHEDNTLHTKPTRVESVITLSIPDQSPS